MIREVPGRQVSKEKFVLLVLHKPEDLIKSEMNATRKSALLENYK
jgi:hypothetical protein